MRQGARGRMKPTASLRQRDANVARWKRNKEAVHKKNVKEGRAEFREQKAKERAEQKREPGAGPEIDWSQFVTEHDSSTEDNKGDQG